jgi:hypothetical protein
MSREIDFEKPLSDEDRAWLHEHSQDHLIAENDRKFKEEPEEEEPEISKEGGQDLPTTGARQPFEPGTRPQNKYVDRPYDRDPSLGEPEPREGEVAGLLPEEQVHEGLGREVVYGEKPGEHERSAGSVEDDLDEWTVEELKDELRSRDLSTSGNKSELVQRLRED